MSLRHYGIYECIDERVGASMKLSGIVMLSPVRDGQEVSLYGGHGQQFLFDDDDEGQIEDSGGVLTFFTPEGKIHFIELTLEDFERQEGRSIFDTPEFKTTKELQDWFRERIKSTVM